MRLVVEFDDKDISLGELCDEIGNIPDAMITELRKSALLWIVDTLAQKRIELRIRLEVSP